MWRRGDSSTTASGPNESRAASRLGQNVRSRGLRPKAPVNTEPSGRRNSQATYSQLDEEQRSIA
jgi:hypothetical protein